MENSDVELAAIVAVVNAVETVTDGAARHRVLQFALSRCLEDSWLLKHPLPGPVIPVVPPPPVVAPVPQGPDTPVLSRHK